MEVCLRGVATRSSCALCTPRARLTPSPSALQTWDTPGERTKETGKNRASGGGQDGPERRLEHDAREVAQRLDDHLARRHVPAAALVP